MVRDTSVLLLAVVAVLAAAGCATHDQWSTWQQHPAHFASGDHLSSSVRNTEGSTPQVTRGDITRATTEAWWGEPITVNLARIIER